MKNTIKSIGRVALFLVILVVLLQITNKVFDPGYWFPSGWIQDRTARLAQLSLEELEAIRSQKAAQRGGFEEKIFLMEVKTGEE